MGKNLKDKDQNGLFKLIGKFMNIIGSNALSLLNFIMLCQEESISV